MLLGIDVSTYFEEEAVGAKYFCDGKEFDPLKAFIDQGVNCMRIRVWNDPYSEDGKPYLGGTNDVDTFIKLGKLAKKYGYSILLDIHYSDFWVDPIKQTVPKAWQGLPFNKIVENVYQFTKDCLVKAKENDLDIPYIQIGNEITNGILWPYAKLDSSTKPRGGYDKLAEILIAGIKASKEIYPDIKTIIHLERSYDAETFEEYFSSIIALGVEFDIIGMSYYPTWHKSFKELFHNVDNCHAKFHKEVMIMETSYGWTFEDYLPGHELDYQMVLNTKILKELDIHLDYPISPEGQKQYIIDLIEQSKKHDVIGIFYWEPMWIPHNEDLCWASKEAQKYIGEENRSTRNEWANQCLFDYQGNMLPAFKEYKVKQYENDKRKKICHLINNRVHFLNARVHCLYRLWLL